MVVVMVCRKCTTRFAIGLHMCPHCTAADAYLEGTEDQMKTSAIGGTTVEGPDGVTRSVDADGNVGDPIHDVDGDTTESTTDEPPQVDTKKAPAKKAAPAKASAK